MPTMSPHAPNYATRYVEEAQCPTHENVLTHGGMDQSGAYYEWWQERNLRPLASTIDTPVLMAQGLADWNVKPDHVATWFNGLQSENKTFIGGQWGHAYPASDDNACPDGYDGEGCVVPWGDWWEYAAAFFDTFLKGVDTGMFEGSVAWAQDNSGTWHRSADWPLLDDRQEVVLHLHPDGTMDTTPHPTSEDDLMGWYACPDDMHNRGTALSAAESETVECSEEPGQSITFTSEPFGNDTLVSGVPLLDVWLFTEGRNPHLTAVVDVLDENGDVVRSRENYGYLNLRLRHGLEQPEDMPAQTAANATLDFYPQEDLIREGERLRLTLASDDGGRTIEYYDEGVVNMWFGSIYEQTLTLPIRPADMQGVRLG